MKYYYRILKHSNYTNIEDVYFYTRFKVIAVIVALYNNLFTRDKKYYIEARIDRRNNKWI
jgi:hypothetical protein